MSIIPPHRKHIAMADVTVIILTLNEEIHIERCILSVKAFAKRIIVVDSYSSDKTCDIARRLGADVFQNRFVNNAVQFNWGLVNGNIATNWVMKVDADEIVEQDLGHEIEQRLSLLPPEITGVNLRYKCIFMNKWIKHGGRSQLKLLRIWRYGYGQLENRWMDEHVILRKGNAVNFKGSFQDHNLNDLAYFVKKHNRYATREAVAVLLTKEELLSGLKTNVRRTHVARIWIKNNVYNRMPLLLAPILYFLYRYIFLGGFLDGEAGLCYHLLQGFWYRFLVGCKLIEFTKAMGHFSDHRQRLEELQRVSGLDLLAAAAL
jgi:glycosyltransferase involved in cell wall biosynthesis